MHEALGLIPSTEKKKNPLASTVEYVYATKKNAIISFAGK
jgi:hypothetical protein